ANQAQNAWLSAEPLLYAAWRQATTKINLRLGGQVPPSFGKFPESERVAAKVQNANTKNLDVVPIWESQVEVSSHFEPPSL
ncbi:hypothetical protein, partial [Aerosakkonema funiforme]|uniref:hypothetical protein n=3 Tax=Oscillatoriophycideae TaxID=1301283 RepID=UPI001A7EC23E